VAMLTAQLYRDLQALERLLEEELNRDRAPK
jgi:hypothetical protein